MRGIRSDNGQASIESVGLTTMIVVLVTAAAAYGAKPDIAGSVTRQFKRGLCVVRAGDCERDRAPCVISAKDRRSREHITIAFVHIDQEKGVIVERLSNGMVRLTRTTRGGFGLEGGLGWNLELDFGKVAFGVGGELRAAAMASARAGASVEVPAAQAKVQLERWLADGLKGPRPKPSTVYNEGGIDVTIGATGTIDPVAKADLVLKVDGALGVRKNVETGHRTFYYKRGRALDAALGVGPEGMREVAGLDRRDNTIYGIEVDAHNRPVDFSVSSLTPLRDASDLPLGLRGSGASLLKGDGERVLATERHLDLTVAENLDVAKRFLAAAALERATFGRVKPVVDDLARRLDTGTFDARSYAVASHDKGFSGDVAVGAKFGAGMKQTENVSRLLGALQRDASGQWADSSFCRTQR
ncbi:MAG TPA: hypothetical protein VNT22_06985 [Baekduia sp.]|nr:hypothetical protein [Baekduia sp.]